MSGLVGAKQFQEFAEGNLRSLGFEIYGEIRAPVLDGSTRGSSRIEYVHTTGLFLCPHFSFYEGQSAGLMFGRCWTLVGRKNRVYSHRYGAFTEYFGLKDMNRFNFMPDSSPECVYADICEGVAETLPTILGGLTYEVLQEIEEMKDGAMDRMKRYFGESVDQAQSSPCLLCEQT